MTAADLSEEMDCWKVGLRRCECGSAVVMIYLPGATLIYCIRCKEYVDGVPDFDPKGANEKWNKNDEKTDTSKV